MYARGPRCSTRAGGRFIHGVLSPSPQVVEALKELMKNNTPQKGRGSFSNTPSTGVGAGAGKRKLVSGALGEPCAPVIDAVCQGS